VVIHVGPDLAAKLSDAARKQGVAPEALALNALRERFLDPQPQPRDEWERKLLAAGSDCGVSLSDEAVGSDGLYD
jgi:hypothetical protein